MTGTTKIYTLYPAFGGFSVKTADYHGVELLVAAVSVRQAYAVAHRDVWINPARDHPVGIVSVYRQDIGPTLWCGCTGHHVHVGVRHGDGIRALRAAINAHRCPRHHQLHKVGPSREHRRVQPSRRRVHGEVQLPP
jgi:hypothetical protein